MTGTYCTFFLGQCAVSSLPGSHFQSYWVAMHVVLSPLQFRFRLGAFLLPTDLTCPESPIAFDPWPSLLPIIPHCVLYSNLTSTPTALGVPVFRQSSDYFCLIVFAQPISLLRNPFHFSTLTHSSKAISVLIPV